MYRLNVKKLGFACGFTGSLLYLGCMILMAIAGKEGTITIYNSLLHGLDTTNNIRMNIPLLESFFGITVTFILGFLIGACIAAFYNAQIKVIK